MPRKPESQRFGFGERGGHNPLLIILSPKTLETTHRIVCCVSSYTVLLTKKAQGLAQSDRHKKMVSECVQHTGVNLWSQEKRPSNPSYTPRISYAKSQIMALRGSRLVFLHTSTYYSSSLRNRASVGVCSSITHHMKVPVFKIQSYFTTCVVHFVNHNCLI